jgi:hypothetical protein
VRRQAEETLPPELRELLTEAEPVADNTAAQSPSEEDALRDLLSDAETIEGAASRNGNE